MVKIGLILSLMLGGFSVQAQSLSCSSVFVNSSVIDAVHRFKSFKEEELEKNSIYVDEQVEIRKVIIQEELLDFLSILNTNPLLKDKVINLALFHGKMLDTLLFMKSLHEITESYIEHKTTSDVATAGKIAKLKFAAEMKANNKKLEAELKRPKFEGNVTSIFKKVEEEELKKTPMARVHIQSENTKRIVKTLDTISNLIPRSKIADYKLEVILNDRLDFNPEGYANFYRVLGEYIELKPFYNLIYKTDRTIDGTEPMGPTGLVKASSETTKIPALDPFLLKLAAKRVFYDDKHQELLSPFDHLLVEVMENAGNPKFFISASEKKEVKEVVSEFMEKTPYVELKHVKKFYEQLFKFNIYVDTI